MYSLPVSQNGGQIEISRLGLDFEHHMCFAKLHAWSLTEHVCRVEVTKSLGRLLVQARRPGKVLLRAMAVLEAMRGVEEAVAVGADEGRPLEVAKGLSQVLLHGVAHEVRVAQAVQSPAQIHTQHVTPLSSTLTNLAEVGEGKSRLCAANSILFRFKL